jgi:hypothetical protein
MTIEEKTQDAVTRAAATPLVYLVYLGKLNAVAIFVSNCEDNDRMRYLKKLSKLMPFDSYGKCFPELWPKFGRYRGEVYDVFAKNRLLQSDYKFILDALGPCGRKG